MLALGEVCPPFPQLFCKVALNSHTHRTTHHHRLDSPPYFRDRHTKCPSTHLPKLSTCTIKPVPSNADIPRCNISQRHRAARRQFSLHSIPTLTPIIPSHNNYIRTSTSPSPSPKSSPRQERNGPRLRAGGRGRRCSHRAAQ